MDEQHPEPTKGRKSVHWRRDLSILRRMARVEDMHLSGMNNVAVAAELGVDERTVRNDLKRLQELWRERIGEQQDVLRGQAVRRLEEVYRRSIAAAVFDEDAERAVLYGQGQPIVRDDDGKAQFKGAKAQALNTARQAAMDIAKILGLVVEKQDTTVTLKAVVDQIAREQGLDPTEVLAEAQSILKASR